MKDIPALYDIARRVCHDHGMPWTDPRTGVTHLPPPVTDERCPCGRTLHYVNSGLRLSVERQIAMLGSTVKITVEARTWHVPRHYIALHRFKGMDLPELAMRFGWKEDA